MAPDTLTSVLRTALRESDATLAGIARAAGVERSSLSRFLAERQSLRLDKADRLAELFGFTITQKSQDRGE
ncbi:MAG: helix-turn-helix domain-containing protein [Planctomycetaceae bacterium]